MPDPTSMLLVITLLVSAAAGPIDATPSSAEARFDDFNAAIDRLVDPRSADKASKVRDGFHARFDDVLRAFAAGELSLDDMDLLFRAIELEIAYTHDDALLAAMRSVFAALSDAGRIRDVHREAFLSALVVTRHLVEARQFVDGADMAGERSLPHLTPLPTSAIDAPTGWRAVERHGATELQQQVVDLEGVRILVVSHPWCGFSAAAGAAIHDDAQLQSLFAAHGIWLVPPSGTFDTPALAAWHVAHPDFPALVAHRRVDFPMLDRWQTPTFYFLRDGDVVYRFSGWPREGNLPAVRSGLVALGLHAGESATSRSDALDAGRPPVGAAHPHD